MDDTEKIDERLDYWQIKQLGEHEIYNQKPKFDIVDVYMVTLWAIPNDSTRFDSLYFLKKELAQKVLDKNNSNYSKSRHGTYLHIVTKKAITFDEGKTVHILPDAKEIMS